eukprot:CAMPEP_0117425908 /NCGR_PEP_ID=MMETSP0758-20121206/6124_1 /TAXON_ID=63605 /ORGANISM="Percolomonas cosmopolitus, Strain AE-1 (ATCC 50343)" /LENGTH=357 /DNA_ID=CAMNT_0005210751 /DNA_START=11 /DNA_END=1080 /DNA_ORIENTATION=-
MAGGVRFKDTSFKTNKKAKEIEISEEDINRHHQNAKKWLNESFKKDDNPLGMAQKTEFIIKIPTYRLSYLKEVEELMTLLCKSKSLDLTMKLDKYSMTISTTANTYDPYIIIRGRDFCRFVARGVPVDIAKMLFEDDTLYEIIPIRKFIQNQDRFIRRRQRLLGPKGETLRSIEILTKTNLVIMGKTVAIMAKTERAINKATEIIVDCMKNIHPLHHIKHLMIRRELENNPEMANADWSKYTPNFKKKSINMPKRKKKKQNKEKGFDSSNPNDPLNIPKIEPSKIDKQLETGEYFMSDAEKEAKKAASIAKRSAAAARDRAQRDLNRQQAPADFQPVQQGNQRDVRQMIDNIQKRKR